ENNHQSHEFRTDKLAYEKLFISSPANFLLQVSNRGVCFRCPTEECASELSVLLWPLVVYHELIQKVFTRLEPILMKRDYSMKGDTQRHKKNPQVDVKTTALAMAITDSELSDEEASILESHHTTAHRYPTFKSSHSLHSEREESFTRDLAEFPSVDELPSIEPGLFDFPLGVFGSEHTLSEEEEAMTPASLLIQHLASPLHFVNTHFNGYGQAVGAPNQSIETSTEDQSDVTLVPAEEEDFEFLDQSELEQMDEGLDLGGDEQEAGRASANMPLSCQQLAEPKSPIKAWWAELMEI
ncbi:hypothetical protein DNTS_015386, partial [Danionella cerebrum]